MIFCTQLTFDLFLRLRSNYRLGIHPYVFCDISRNNISMGRIMYSILPSKVKRSVFFPMGLPTNESLVFVTIWDCRTHVPMTSLVERTDFGFQNFCSPAIEHQVNTRQQGYFAGFVVLISLFFGFLCFIMHLSLIDQKLIWAMSWGYGTFPPP